MNHTRLVALLLAVVTGSFFTLIVADHCAAVRFATSYSFVTMVLAIGNLLFPDRR